MQLETEMNTRAVNELKTACLLDALLQKIQNTETRSGQFQQQLQGQKS